MARLPHPGGDNGNWGTILNTYLSQVHKSDGTLKTNSVTSDAIAPNSVTNAAIATDAVNAASIANGSISEALLDSGVQTKLNATTDWDTLSDKPAVIAAGSDQAAARTAIDAPSIAAMQDIVKSWASADAYIDFTTKPNGDPPSVLDTGQAVIFTLTDGSGWKPQMLGGKLIRGTVPASGQYADYYQAQLDGDCRTFGARFVVDSSDGSTTSGVVCVAVWANPFAGAGTTVPKTPAHITLDTITGAWSWWVSDGGPNHLKAVKLGTFTPPASDGVTVWEVSAYIDPDNGIAHLSLPGNDAATGTRYVTVTDTEIASLLTAQSVPVTTLAATLSGADVVMVEHFTTSAPTTARFPKYLSMWGETRRLPRDASRAIRQKAITPPAITYKRYHPNPAVTISPTASMSPVDATNAVVTATAGPAGKILFEVDCYYEFTGTDVVLMRFVSGGTTSTSEVVVKGTTGNTVSVHHTFEKTGLTPGATANWRIDHQCQNSAVSMKIGGSGSFATVPGLYIKATPV